jgi:hypothetical protein
MVSAETQKRSNMDENSIFNLERNVGTASKDPLQKNEERSQDENSDLLPTPFSSLFGVRQSLSFILGLELSDLSLEV